MKELDEFLDDPIAYETLLQEIFDMQQLVHAELADLTNAFKPSVRNARIRMAVENIMNSLKRFALDLVNSQYLNYMYGTSKTDARDRYNHLLSVRRAIKVRMQRLPTDEKTVEGSSPVIQDDDGE